MHYSIRHITRFRYSRPVHESVMELRMQPRSEGPQALRSFQIATNPRAQLYAYTDHLGNAVYHFNVLREHTELRIETQSLIEMTTWRDPPQAADPLEWDRYNTYNLSAEQFDLLEDSKFSHMSQKLSEFLLARGLVKPEGDALSALKHLNQSIYQAFEYKTGVTDASSPIDDALKAGVGVCQDFAHIMIAAARSWGVPARYVSGYLHHGKNGKDRSQDDATHAWVEIYFPSMGWVGFDPTNDIMAGERHIRVAVGRDYADVPPTRGTYKGGAESELGISVSVQPTQAPIRHEEFLRVAHTIKPGSEPPTRAEQFYQQQQQQQQQ
jgi:transglutaminase-like putative cysteine protease